MYSEMKHLDRALEDNEADFEAIDTQLRDSDNLMSDIQSKREKTLEKSRLLELELTQLQIKRDSVANRLEERYHNHFSVLRSEYHDSIEDRENSADMPIEEMEAELAQCREKIAKIIFSNHIATIWCRLSKTCIKSFIK